MLIPMFAALFTASLTAFPLGCTHAAVEDSGTPATVGDVPYIGEHAELSQTSPMGRAWKRGIIHLHSPYSHDACDNNPMPGGVPDENCLQDQRDGLCATREDYAFMTDHPDYASYQTYETMLLPRDDDQLLADGKIMTCSDGHVVTLMPGIEDELMPIGLKRQVSLDAAENERIYNDSDQEAFDQERAAGAIVMQAHTEGQDIDTLLSKQAMGLTGTEMFNLHAMVDPTKRQDDLGLDAYGYLDDIAPFLTGTTHAEPDMAFLAFYQQQDVSIERWDALNAVGPMVGTAGTDAHENAIPSLMSDGERVDSYRRMMIWFSNYLLVDGSDSGEPTPSDYQDAVAAGRLFVAFEILGEPGEWDVHYGDLEMGGTAPLGDDLVVTCPTLSPTSPQKDQAPDITVAVYKDGVLWHDGCGTFTPTEPGVYRAVATITPWQLSAFLDDQQQLIKPTPWLYSNALRIGL